MSLFANVVILRKKINPLTYKVPSSMKDILHIGSLVVVPLKNVPHLGFVIEITESMPNSIDNSKVFDIIECLSEETFFDDKYLKFFNFSATYYSATLSEVFKSFFSPSMLRKKQTFTLKTLNPLDPVSQFLSQHKKCSLDKLLKAFPNLEYKHIRELEEKGLIEINTSFIFKSIYYDMSFFDDNSEKRSLTLTNEQQRILKDIESFLYKPRNFLIIGKTGTGKTELLLALSQSFFNKGFSVLYLVPEIAIATNIYKRFTSILDKKHILIWHSSVPPHIKRFTFEQIRNKANVVIGTRSSIFLPIYKLGLIIVDEEHDASFKHEGSFPYNARDLALTRGKFFSHPVVLSSATPSMETYYKAISGEINLYTLSQRFHPKKPEIIVIDTEKTKLIDGFFSSQLLENIEENLLKKEQSLIFINRRGYVPYAYCNECKNFILCKFCTVPLTWHKKKNAFSCHRCGFITAFKSECPVCKKNNIFFYGAGTEKITELLSQKFPHAKIIKIDRETTEKPQFLKKELQQIVEGSYDIIVATQILTKSHHFPKLTFVGVLLGDQGLKIPDFRAQERTFQLLTQVFGRAGRELPGKVIIQTSITNSPSINFAINEDFEGFFKEEILLRQQTEFPPIKRLLVIKIFSKDEKRLYETSQNIYNEAFRLSKKWDIQVFQPIPAPVYRERGLYKLHIYCKSKKPKHLISLSQHLKANIKNTTCKIIFDIDPYNLL
jgi:primosomal protein N' (replication factor Y)